MKTELRTVVSRNSKVYPLIGSRYVCEHIERRDTQAGTYECINSPMVSRTELLVQRALLKGKK